METDSYDRSQLEEALAADDGGRGSDSTDGDESSTQFNTDAIETGPIDLAEVEKAAAASRATDRREDAPSTPASTSSSAGDSATDAYTAELDFSTLEAAESGEITPLTQRRPSSSAE
jgi:hypothetical protein